MPIRVIATVIMCITFTLNSFPGIFVNEKILPAMFDGYIMTLADGETLEMRAAGKKLIFSSSVVRDYKINLIKTRASRIEKNYRKHSKTFEIDCTSVMDEGELYTVEITYEAYGVKLIAGNNIIYLSSNNLYFWKSVNYEYNQETCSELWTDAQSLKECLEPQNDIECDDPVIIEYSKRICEGAADDWEKVFRIYKYIAHEMAYDVVEMENDSSGYQDSALDVIRDGKGICEGFANAFVALSRVQGIPAVVEYGLGLTDYQEMTHEEYSQEVYSNHAWAAVYLGDKWHFLDPTFDMSRYYEGPEDVIVQEDRTANYLLTLEAFSNNHKILDADTRHGLESAGRCGGDATYEITRDGVCHISGEGEVVMPAGVCGFSKVVFEEGSNITAIGDAGFEDCDLLTSVVLPDTIESIGYYAFLCCQDMDYIYLPDSVQYIGYGAFGYCDELSYVKIPDSVYFIDEQAFDYCPRLYISLPSKLAGFEEGYEMAPLYVEYR